MNPDFRDILSEFCDAQVEFLLVGAYALAAHGLPRATGDIDLWVRPSPENAVRVMTALRRFGAPMTQIEVSDFAKPGVVFQIGVAPQRVDILTEISAVGFEEAWASRIEVEIEGLKISVIGRDHLVRNKRAAGRPKDLVDLSWLEEQGQNPLEG